MSTVQRWLSGRFVNGKKPQKREPKKVHLEKRKYPRPPERLFRPPCD